MQLTLRVPAAAREAVAREFGPRYAAVQRRVLSASVFDTADRRLVRKGLLWLTLREGRRCTQALGAPGDDLLALPDAVAVAGIGVPDPLAHDALPAGQRLQALLAKAEPAGPAQPAVTAWLRLEVRRQARQIRTRGAVVSVVHDQGRLAAADRTAPLDELCFTLRSGPPAAALALLERWQRRFGLEIETRSWIDRAQRLERGESLEPPRRAAALAYAPLTGEAGVLGHVLDECLDQVLRNGCAIATAGDAPVTEHVHQMRVGIRRLRSALRTLEDWTPPPPAALVDDLRALFGALGQARDGDVLAAGVAARLAQVGAPALRPDVAAEATHPGELLRRPASQRLLLAWWRWRHAMADDASAGLLAEGPSTSLGERAARRLARWHRRVDAAARGFEGLDEPALHALRKRIKRQRYAVEFLAPLLRRREVERYLQAIAVVQEKLGELNDLFVAREHYQARVEAEPAAWFAIGWLAARIVDGRAEVLPVLQRLARTDPPSPARAG